MKRALEEVIFAAASDEARPILTGVLAKFEGSKLTLAAADNYRIAVRTIDILDPVEAASVVIPARALGELARILADTDDPVELVLAQARNQVLFHLEGVDLVSRLIDGQFPNYQQVLPATHATRAELDREELLRAVRPAALIASSSANIVKLPGGRRRHRGDRHGDGRRGRLHRRRRGDDRGRRRRPSRSTPATSTTCSATCRPTGSRSSSTGPLVAGRLPAGRRRRVRPRRDARPDDVLTDALGAPPRTRRRATSGPRRARARRTDPARALGPRPARLRGARRGVHARPAARVGPERRGQDQPARGDRPRWPGADPIARPPTASSSAGARSWRASRRRVGRARRPSAGPRDAVEVALVRTASGGARKRIRVNGVARRAAALVGVLRTVMFAPEEMLLVAGSPSLRREALDRLAGQRSPAYLRRPRDLRPCPPAAQRPAAADPRGAGDARRAAVLGRDAAGGRQRGARRAPAPAGGAGGPAGGRPRGDRPRRGRGGPRWS